MKNAAAPYAETWDPFRQRFAGEFWLDKQRFEREFVDRVLSRVPSLNPAAVRPQQAFTGHRGRGYRMDFGIAEGPFVRIAIEVDGYDKVGRGGGMTRDEFDDWVAREAELKALGWYLLRFTNRGFTADPAGAIRHIELALRQQRQQAAERLRADASARLTTAEREELERLRLMPRVTMKDLDDMHRRRAAAHLRADEQQELERLRLTSALTDRERLDLETYRASGQSEIDRVREALERAEHEAALERAQNARMGRVAIGLGLVFGAALISFALISNRAGPPPPPTPTTQGTDSAASLSITGVSTPVARTKRATVSAATTPQASCSIVVTYSSGVPSTAQGLEDKRADTNGRVAWSWTVGSGTALGEWPIAVTCEGTTVRTKFQVTS